MSRATLKKQSYSTIAMCYWGKSLKRQAVQGFEKRKSEITLENRYNINPIKNLVEQARGLVKKN
jgi:hypothetical protein